MSWIGLTLVENFANLNLIQPRFNPKKKKKKKHSTNEITKAKSRLIKKRKEAKSRLHIGFVELVD